MPVVGKLWASVQFWAIQHFLLALAALIVVGRMVCRN